MSEPHLVMNTVTVADDGRIKLSGATCGRIVAEEGLAYFEVKDRNHHRSDDRGAALLRIQWRDLVAAVEDYLGSAVV